MTARFDAVIFDIDNVLVDTRASYTDCIRKTAETYLETVLNFRPSRLTLLTREDIESFKSFGGFNDDWDTCYGLLLYFLSNKVRKRAVYELWKKKNIIQLARTIKPKPLGVKGAEKIWGARKEVILSKIADIFQRFYLNEFVWNEKLIISKTFLKQLKRKGIKLGIVTGRSREEAGFALRRFKIDSLIDGMVTVDDTPKDLKKPNPYGLLKIASKFGKNLRYLYVGDLPDDILAAARAKKKIKILSCGFLAVSTQPQEMKRSLKKVGANYICATVSELKELITRK